jgi:hypothetical protein
LFVVFSNPPLSPPRNSANEDLTGYFNTWSSVQHFIKANGYNPVDALAETISSVWREDEARPFYFPLFVRLGKVDITSPDAQLP